MLKSVIRLLLLGSILILSACSNKIGPAEAYKGKHRQIFQSVNLDAKGDYSEAIKRFEALEVQYPLEHETELAEVQLVYACIIFKEDLSSGYFFRPSVLLCLHPMSQYTTMFFHSGPFRILSTPGVLDRLFSVDLAKRDLEPMKSLS